MLIEKVSQMFSSRKAAGMLTALFFGYLCSGMLIKSPAPFIVMLSYVALVIFFQNRLKAAIYIYLFAVFFIPSTIGIETRAMLFNIDRLILAVILGSWAVMLSRGRTKVCATPVDAQFILYLAVISISALWNIDSILTNGDLAKSIKKISVISLERILVVYVIISVLKTRAEIRRMLSFIILCLSIVAAYGIFESAVRDNIFLRIKTIKNPKVIETTFSKAIRFGLYRAKSTQVLPHIFGTALCMILPLQIFYFLYQNGKARLLAALAMVLTIGGIAVTYTRGVYIACALGVSLSFIFLKNISKKMMLIGLIACILFIGLQNQRVVTFCTEYIAKLLNPSTAAFDREHSLQGRMSDYRFTVSRMKNRLLLGQGYGTYTAGAGFDQYLDNAYLYALIETGIVGFAVFLFLIYGIVFKIGRLLIKYQERDFDIYMCRFIHIGLIVFFFQCLTYDAFVFAGASKLFWVLLGLLLAYLKFSEETIDGYINSNSKL